MMDVTGVDICLACMSGTKEIIEMFKLRDYQGINLEDTIEKEQ